MTEPNNQSADSDSEPDDTSIQNQSVGNVATGSQSPRGRASERNWILYLPPEVRLRIYGYVFQLPFALPYDSQLLCAHPVVQSLTGILRTSRLFRTESLAVFYGESTFFVQTWSPRFTILPSQQIGDIVQHFEIEILVSFGRHDSRNLFINIIHALGNSAIIRSTLKVHLFLSGPSPHLWPRPPLEFHLGGLGRFTNFRIVELNITYNINQSSQVTQPYRDRIENALHCVLGPARPTPRGNGLIFHPQQFLNAQLRRQNLEWTDHLDGIRLDWNRDESNADQRADESDPPA
ncbi:hypothetical protein MMC29_001337 [Sticta canariensis]|nr:hypothetical protein [Sticta canariensis]